MIPKEFDIYDLRLKRWLDKEEVLRLELGELSRSDLAVMQNTGLYDFYSVELHEYDIVKSLKGTVFYIKYNPVQGKFNIDENSIRSRQLHLIGNIFTNINLIPLKYRQKIKEEIYNDRGVCLNA